MPALCCLSTRTSAGRDITIWIPMRPAHVGEPKRFPEISDAAYQFPGETDIVE